MFDYLIGDIIYAALLILPIIPFSRISLSQSSVLFFKYKRFISLYPYKTTTDMNTENLKKAKTLKIINMIISLRQEIEANTDSDFFSCYAEKNKLSSLENHLLHRFGFKYKNKTFFSRLPDLSELFDANGNDPAAIYGALSAKALEFHQQPIVTIREWLIEAKKANLKIDRQNATWNIGASVYPYFVFVMYKRGFARLEQTIDAFRKSRIYDRELFCYESGGNRENFLKTLQNLGLPLFKNFLRYEETDKFKEAKRIIFYKEDFERLYFEVV
ncbi:MAG: hypothetical protein Fur0041_14040 [Bacteroidia bacterium]